MFNQIEEPLKFEAFTFKEGLNVTVRKGDKWYKNGVGYVVLSTVDGTETKKGIITGVTYVPFKVVNYIELKNEHDPKCRTYKKLLKVMKEVYEEFEETDYVTVVRFKVFEED